MIVSIDLIYKDHAILPIVCILLFDLLQFLLALSLCDQYFFDQDLNCQGNCDRDSPHHCRCRACTKKRIRYIHTIDRTDSWRVRVDWRRSRPSNHIYYPYLCFCLQIIEHAMNRFLTQSIVKLFVFFWNQKDGLDKLHVIHKGRMEDTKQRLGDIQIVLI